LSCCCCFVVIVVVVVAVFVVVISNVIFIRLREYIKDTNVYYHHHYLSLLPFLYNTIIVYIGHNNNTCLLCVAKTLADVGILTVDGLGKQPDLLELLMPFGLYLDKESLAIEKYDV